MIDINESYITDDLDMLSEILNPVEEKTIKLEEGENRVVSILFLDVKGFTAMSEKMDSENVKRTMDKILTAFSNSIIKFGGYIDKYEGDLIMALFGSKITSETDTERAINAGLKILADLKHVNKILNIDLSIRIGINTGEVTTGKIGMKREGDFTVYGDAVNLASRMESNAPLNSIMIPKGTKEIVEDSFIFEDLGEILVKGKEKPISIFKVVSRNLNKIERWERNSRIIKRSAYVGRDKEIDEIIGKYIKSKKEIGNKDENYKPILIGLKGEAGIGKSRLVKELMIKIENKSILKGYTKSYAQPAYHIWLTILKNYFKIEEDDTKDVIKNKLESSIDELNSFFGDDDDSRELLYESRNIIAYMFGVKYDDKRLINIDPKTLQSLINFSVKMILEIISLRMNDEENLPLIIFLDDCQWMDDPSINLLKSFLNSLNSEEKRMNKKNLNIFFLLTYRPEYDAFAAFNNDSYLTEYKLIPLSIDNSKKLIRSMFGKKNDIPSNFIDIVMGNSEGNPFYIEEIINYLVEHEKIVLKDDIWILSDNIDKIKIPLSLNKIILSRIDKLHVDSKSILQTASVIGNYFFKTVLNEITNKVDRNNKIDTRSNFNKLLDDFWIYNDLGITGNNIENDDKYLFKHILTAEVCYNTLLNYNKRILHKLIAETTEELFTDNKEYYSFIAKHYEKSEPDKDSKEYKKLIEYLEKAGNYAKHLYHNDEAIKLYDKLLLYLNESESSDEIIEKEITYLLKRGQVFQLIGKWDNALKDYEDSLARAEVYSDISYHANVLYVLGTFYYLRGKHNEAKECFDKSLNIYEELENDIGICDVVGSIGTYHSHKGDNDKAKECFDKQYKISKKLKDNNRIASALSNFASYNDHLGNYKEALKIYNKVLEINIEIGDKRGTSRILANMGVIYNDKDNHKKAREYFEKQLVISEELGDSRLISTAQSNLGNVCSNEGDLDGAMKYYEKAQLSMKSMGNKSVIARNFGNIAILYSSRGEYPLAIDIFNKGLAIFEELDDKNGISITYSNLGNIYTNTEEYDKAIEYFDKSISIDNDISFKYHMPYCYMDKANCLYSMKDYFKAKESVEKCYKISKEIDDYYHIFSSKMLIERIGFKLALNNAEKLLIIENLKIFLNKEKDEEKIAFINYEITMFIKKLKEDYSEYKDKAINIYKKLYKKTPKIYYKNKYEELEKL